MQWLRRILLAILGIFVFAIALLVGIFAFDVFFGAKATDFTNLTYLAADGTEIHAYLAMPEEEGQFPAIIMIHEWWGLNSELIEMADRMAAEGYVVLAPDTYHGETTSLIPRALYLRITVPEERVDADVQAAFDYLLSMPNVDSENIGIIGFCYGGGVALRHAVLNPRIAATVNLYGDTIADPNAFGALLNENAGPVLGIFGSVDSQIPVSEVEAFEAALNTANIENTITIYEGMGHAFVQPDLLDETGAPQTAWQQILNFFADTLQDAEAN